MHRPNKDLYNNHVFFCVCLYFSLFLTETAEPKFCAGNNGQQTLRKMKTVQTKNIYFLSTRFSVT